MKWKWTLLLLGALPLLLLVASCGVPREAAQLAKQAATASATTLPADDAAVRQMLIAQDAQWQQLSSLLQKREFGGITGVDPDFISSVKDIAAVAHHQHDLITQNQDDPQFNRQAMTRFQSLWQSASKYLNP